MWNLKVSFCYNSTARLYEELTCEKGLHTTYSLFSTVGSETGLQKKER